MKYKISLRIHTRQNEKNNKYKNRFQFKIRRHLKKIKDVKIQKGVSFSKTKRENPLWDEVWKEKWVRSKQNPLHKTQNGKNG